MTQEIGPLARKAAMPYYDTALPGHDRFHANRVRELSLWVANEWDKRVDTDVLSAATWVHDIGRPLERTGEIENRGEWAATEAEDILGTEGVRTDRIEDVKHCLRTHSIRPSSPTPETPEAKALFDADKLEVTGAVGIVRMACIVGERSGRTGEKHAVIDDSTVPEDVSADLPDVTILREWAQERLEMLYTPPGRRLGQSRWQFMESFFSQFSRERRIDDRG